MSKKNTHVSDKDMAIITARRTNTLLGIIAVALFILFYQVVQIKKEKSTILQFPSGAQSEIKYDDVDNLYLMQVASFMSDTLYSASPATAGTELSAILSMAHPSVYKPLKQKLDAHGAKIKS